MRGKPPLSILIPWCDRDELRVTLEANAPVFRAHDAEVLVLNCGGGSEHLRGLIDASKVRDVRQLDIAAPGFSRSLSLNIGLARARSDTVFTLDADIILPEPLPVEAMDPRSFVTIACKRESASVVPGRALDDPPIPPAKSAFVEFSFRGGVKIRHQVTVPDPSGRVRGGSGLLLIGRADLLQIQGYNSDLDSWGWEDDDVLIRLQYLLGRRRVQAGVVLHLTHDDSQRVRSGSRQQSDQRNFLKCCRNYNNGLFLGTYDSDLARLGERVTELPGGGA